MTAKAELTPRQRRYLQEALAVQKAAEAALQRAVAQLVKETSYGAVARELGISRQAVQQRLGAARGRRASASRPS